MTTETFTRASSDIANFIRLQALLPLLGVSHHDMCLHSEEKENLLVRLMRDAGYSYYQWSDKSSDSISVWKQPRTGLKVFTWFEESLFTDPVADAISALDQAFAVGPEFILGLMPVNSQTNAKQQVDLIIQLAERGKYQAYLVGRLFLLSQFPLPHSVLLKIEDSISDEHKLIGESFFSWLNSGSSMEVMDENRALKRKLLRNAGFRLAVDGTFFRYQTGLARMWKSLLREWSANGFAEFIWVIDRENKAPKFPNLHYVSAPAHNGSDRAADKALIQNLCDQHGISLFISTYYSTPQSTPAFLVVPDMIPEVLGFDLQTNQWQEKHEAIRYCERYFSISISTSRDLRSFFPGISEERVTNAYCGSDFRTQSKESVELFKQKYQIDRPYFMLSGAKTNQKNGELFFQAFARLGSRRSEFAVVCTNSMPTLEPEFLQHMGEGKFHGLILNDAELQCAYSGALALAYPSRYEGFGLPVLESMACSCPVITCNNSSLGEVGGDAVIYVDPDNVDEMFSALQNIQNTDIREHLISQGLIQAKRFNWRDMAYTMENEFAKFGIK
jgi:glycosyltransferase involved in cell wall biosynthesis